jgi:hypothetical protein
MLALKAALESDKFDLAKKRTQEGSEKPVHEWVIEHADAYYAWLLNKQPPPEEPQPDLTHRATPPPLDEP